MTFLLEICLKFFPDNADFRYFSFVVKTGIDEKFLSEFLSDKYSDNVLLHSTENSSDKRI